MQLLVFHMQSRFGVDGYRVGVTDVFDLVIVMIDLCVKYPLPGCTKFLIRLRVLPNCITKY